MWHQIFAAADRQTDLLIFDADRSTLLPSRPGSELLQSPPESTPFRSWFVALELPRPAIDYWLDPKVSDPDELKPMLRHLPSEEMQSWTVGKAVGNVRNQGPALMEPVDKPEDLKF
jgi:hypothetical protein